MSSDSSNTHRNESMAFQQSAEQRMSHRQCVSYESIANQLLSDNYLLTALELHSELLDAGKELPRLTKFFSNPANFDLMSGLTSHNSATASNICESFLF